MGRNKIGTEGRKRLRSFISRPMLELPSIRIGNTFMERFMLRIGNVLETFMARERFGIYSYPFSDLCASCHIQLCLFKLNLKFRNRFKVIYEYIYLYIYIYIYIYIFAAVTCYPTSWHHTLEFSLLNCILWFIFSPKVMLLVRKSYYKNQCINLIGLAPVQRPIPEIGCF